MALWRWECYGLNLGEKSIFIKICMLVSYAFLACALIMVYSNILMVLNLLWIYFVSRSFNFLCISDKSACMRHKLARRVFDKHQEY